MPFAAELYFDEDGEAAVRGLWDALEAAGVGSLATAGHGRHIPHLSLTVCDEMDVDAAAAGLQAVASGYPSLIVDLSHVGVFAGEANVVFAGVTLTDELLGLHALCRKALSPVSSSTWDHYLPNRWVPHCTLAMPVPRDKVGAAVAAVIGAGMPVAARARGIGIADVTSGDIVIAGEFTA